MSITIQCLCAAVGSVRCVEGLFSSYLHAHADVVEALAMVRAGNISGPARTFCDVLGEERCLHAVRQAAAAGGTDPSNGASDGGVGEEGDDSDHADVALLWRVLHGHPLEGPLNETTLLASQAASASHLRGQGLRSGGAAGGSSEGGRASGGADEASLSRRQRMLASLQTLSEAMRQLHEAHGRGPLAASAASNSGGNNSNISSSALATVSRQQEEHMQRVLGDLSGSTLARLLRALHVALPPHGGGSSTNSSNGTFYAGSSSAGAGTVEAEVLRRPVGVYEDAVVFDTDSLYALLRASADVLARHAAEVGPQGEGSANANAVNATAAPDVGDDGADFGICTPNVELLSRAACLDVEGSCSLLRQGLNGSDYDAFYRATAPVQPGPMDAPSAGHATVEFPRNPLGPGASAAEAALAQGGPNSMAARGQAAAQAPPDPMKGDRGGGGSGSGDGSSGDAGAGASGAAPPLPVAGAMDDEIGAAFRRGILAEAAGLVNPLTGLPWPVPPDKEVAGLLMAKLPFPFGLLQGANPLTAPPPEGGRPPSAAAGQAPKGVGPPGSGVPGMPGVGAPPAPPALPGVFNASDETSPAARVLPSSRQECEATVAEVAIAGAVPLDGRNLTTLVPGVWRPSNVWLAFAFPQALVAALRTGSVSVVRSMLLTRRASVNALLAPEVIVPRPAALTASPSTPPPRGANSAAEAPPVADAGTDGEAAPPSLVELARGADGGRRQLRQRQPAEAAPAPAADVAPPASVVALPAVTARRAPGAIASSVRIDWTPTGRALLLARLAPACGGSGGQALAITPALSSSGLPLVLPDSVERFGADTGAAAGGPLPPHSLYCTAAWFRPLDVALAMAAGELPILGLCVLNDTCAAQAAAGNTLHAPLPLSADAATPLLHIVDALMARGARSAFPLPPLGVKWLRVVDAGLQGEDLTRGNAGHGRMGLVEDEGLDGPPWATCVSTDGTGCPAGDGSASADEDEDADAADAAALADPFADSDACDPATGENCDCDSPEAGGGASPMVCDPDTHKKRKRSRKVTSKHMKSFTSTHISKTNDGGGKSGKSKPKKCDPNPFTNFIFFVFWCVKER